MNDWQFPSVIDVLWRNPRRSADEIRARADEQLRRLLVHAGEHVPLYRNLWKKHGFDPRGVRTAQDLCAAPMVDKNAIVEAGDDAVDSRLAGQPLDTMSTSGTSGRSITIRRVPKEMRLTRRSYLRSLMLVGGRPWHRTLTMASTWLAKKKGVIMSLIARAQYIHPKTPIDEQIRLLHETRAQYLIGQTGGLYLLAAELLRRGETFPLRIVGPTGATLMPMMRQAMRDAFKAEPRDLYGAVELGTVSWQCRHGSYHVDADRMVVEIVDEKGRPVPMGSAGQVVCTSLYGYTMPLIRYKLLDVASMLPGKCPCGLPFPMMGPVQGRINDFLPTPRGELVSPHYLYHVFDHAGSHPVKEWRIIQHAVDRMTYEYVPETSFDPKALEHGMNVIRERFGPELKLEVRQVESVPMTPNGKRTCIVSELKPDDFGGMRPWDRRAAAGMSADLALTSE